MTTVSAPSGQSTVAVVRAGPNEAAHLFHTLTLAFGSDPPTRWLFPTADQHVRCLARFAQALGGAAFGRRTAYSTEDGTGVALWLPPDAHADEAALVELVKTDVAPRERADAFAVFEEMARYHPAEPHWYLPLIGVDPAWQGRGLGAALLKATLTQFDAMGAAAYLESTNPRNRPLYERHGFAVVCEIRVGSCPPITPMLRHPQRAGRQC